MRLGSSSGVPSGSSAPSLSFVDLTNAHAAARGRGDEEAARHILVARNAFLGRPAGAAVPLAPDTAALVQKALGL